MRFADFALLVLIATRCSHAATIPGQAPNDRVVAAVRSDQELSLDGRLDEPVWSQAVPATDFIQRELRNGEPANQRTEVRLLSAEALEAQGNWEEAANEYRRVLDQNPHLSGIHYRLGRVILSAPKTDTTMEDARKEFEAELKIDPSNAGAEFILGKLVLEPATLNDAIAHFSRAVKLDASFAEAYIELGNALILAGRPAEALKPLATAARLQPENPMPHFRLSNAYIRLGRKEDAQKEVAIYKELSEKVRQNTERVQKAVSGVTDEKPD